MAGSERVGSALEGSPPLCPAHARPLSAPYPHGRASAALTGRNDPLEHDKLSACGAQSLLGWSCLVHHFNNGKKEYHKRACDSKVARNIPPQLGRAGASQSFRASGADDQKDLGKNRPHNEDGRVVARSPHAGNPEPGASVGVTGHLILAFKLLVEPAAPDRNHEKEDRKHLRDQLAPSLVHHGPEPRSDGSESVDARASAQVIVSGPRAHAGTTQRPTSHAPAAHGDPHPRRVPGLPPLERDSTRPLLFVAVRGRVIVGGRVLPAGVHEARLSRPTDCLITPP